jgi:hypothetical protein
MKAVKMMTILLAVSLAVLCIAGPAKDPISGTGSSTLVLGPPPPGTIMQFAGSIDMVVRGETKTADLVVNVYSVAENEGGVQHVSASHVLTFDDGSTITTADKEVATPTDVPGLYALNGNLKVVSGTGAYEGASGHFTAHGTMDFRALPVASFEIRGALSSPAVD